MRRYLDLTPAQQRAFEAIALGQDPIMASATVNSLLRRGLIMRVGNREVGRDRFGAVMVPVYEVPVGEHIKWCTWCYDRTPAPSARTKGKRK